MNRGIRWVLIALAVALVSHLPAGTASAQTKIAQQAIAKAEAAIKKTMKACGADIKAYCPRITPGEGRLALCMMAHDDQISDNCFVALMDVADDIELALSNISRAVDVCEVDANKYCSKVQPGEGRIAQCLIDNKSKLASICRAEVAGFEARFQK